MRQSLLPLLLLTTVTLSLSDVFPIVSEDQTDAEPSDSDQEYDNTFNSVHNDRNIFYELFKEPSENKKATKTRRKYKSYPVRSSNDEPRKNDNYDDKGFRKEQWHNYPRQLDRLHRSSYEYPEVENILSDYDYNEKRKKDSDDLRPINNEDVPDSTNIGDVAGPLFILKIRLAFLTNNMKKFKSNKNDYTNSIQLDSTDLNKLDTERDEGGQKLLTTTINSIVNTKKERDGKLKKGLTFSEIDPEEKKSVNKRIFSLWSRLQSLSHKGHELHHRRHLYTSYGLPDNSGGTLTAETRASLVRPPGSPLRWG